MTEQDWLRSGDATAMVEFLRSRPVGPCKFWRFGLACSARVPEWDTRGEERRREQIEQRLERLEPLPSDAPIDPADRDFLANGGVFAWHCTRDLLQRAYHVAIARRTRAEPNTVQNSAFWQSVWEDTSRVEKAAHCRLLRCVFGPLPFRDPPRNPAWLEWNDAAVLRLARTIHADQLFDQLPVLADALEDAGCDDSELLGHCREETLHARGCWVLALLLGRGGPRPSLPG